jgi:hypothetical protein
MKYKTSLKLSLKYYPTIYPLGEYSVLEQMFFVNGNGLWWSRGELTDGRTIKQLEEDDERYKKQQKEFLEERIIDTDSKYIKELFMEWLSNGHYGPPPDPPDTNHEYKLYPLYERSTIMELPDNIKDDWLLAAEKALDMVKKGIYIASEEDKKYLRRARIRVNKLKKSRRLK